MSKYKISALEVIATLFWSGCIIALFRIFERKGRHKLY